MSLPSSQGIILHIIAFKNHYIYVELTFHMSFACFWWDVCSDWTSQVKMFLVQNTHTHTNQSPYKTLCESWELAAQVHNIMHSKFGRWPFLWRSIQGALEGIIFLVLASLATSDSPRKEWFILIHSIASALCSWVHRVMFTCWNRLGVLLVQGFCWCILSTMHATDSMWTCIFSFMKDTSLLYQWLSCSNGTQCKPNVSLWKYGYF